MKKHNIILALSALMLIFSMGLDSPKDFDFRPGKRLIVKGNMFEAGSATLSNQESAWLKELSAYLAKRPNLYMEIVGYTDNQGDSLANKRLSEARANAVKEYLVRNSVAAARIKTLGRGSENPIASNDTDEGRGKNRRVEITATSPFTERPLTNRNNTPLAPEGRITAMLPPVRSLAPWDVDWHPAKLSEPIYEYHRLETGAKARAEITFANKHRVQIAEQSVVVLYGQAASPLAGKPSEQLRLVQGGLWIKLKSLKESETLRISTNSGEFALGQSSAKIEVDSAKRSLVSVHTGNITLKSTEGATTGASMTVKENFGTRIAANMPPEQPRLLPPVPQLLEPLGMDSLYAGTISFLWRKTAPRTRFEVANAITFDKPLHSITSQGDSADVLLPEGEWYVKLAAIDSIGLESRSSIYLFRIGKPLVPQRFYALSLVLFIGAALAGWWGGLTKQPRIAWWSLAFTIAGCTSFFLLHW